MDPATPLHIILFRDNEDLFQACLRGRFITGLASGSLPLPAFRRYIQQDFLFLADFVRAAATAVEKCAGDEELIGAYATLIRGGVDEMESLKPFDDGPLVRSAATQRISEFLHAAAGDQDIGVALAAFAPCLTLYAYLGRKLEPALPQSGGSAAYAAWVAKYASDATQQLARRWEALVDERVVRPREVGQTYRQALELEVEFFESAL